TRALFNVDFRDDSFGFAVGGGGTILRTEDGGRNWERIPTSFTDTLMRVDFADDKNGWIVGHNGIILRSDDRGRTWGRQESGVTGSLYGLFMSKKYGWAVGAKGAVISCQK
ncbi:MAG TPA: YCF48-related protein, partial [Pyrinomonadaceae bacterium]|nr:YCF48-related protein [Pyrinomonadaceae bacterium]